MRVAILGKNARSERWGLEWRNGQKMRQRQKECSCQSDGKRKGKGEERKEREGEKETHTSVIDELNLGLG